MSAAGSDGDGGAPAQDDGVLAGLDGELAQVRRDEHGGTSGARVGDDVHGRLDAERVDAVEGLVEQQHGRLVEGREDHRHPAAHAVAEPGGHPVRHGAEVEPLEQLPRTLLPVVEPAQPGCELEVLPRRRSRHEAADVRAVAGRAASPSASRCGCRGRRRCTSPPLGGMTPASTRIVVDLPAPLRPRSAVAAPGATAKSIPRTASTSPNRT